ncbi:MAG: CheR family methyltransferase [Deltaproteobacteria bacterium]
MDCKINADLLARLATVISESLGLRFGPERANDLERALVNASPDFGFNDPLRFAEWLGVARLSKEETERLASHLTVGETYFFRDKEVFDGLEQTILPDLMEKRRVEKRLRIWSAGCSTGEEPYSLAMMLSAMMFDMREWNITILATDISSKSLQKAAEASYGEWSFRSVPSYIKERYFNKTSDGRYILIDRIKKMVEFKYLNLAGDAYPSLLNNTNAMDLILCRNVLMYFSEATGAGVAQKLRNCLVDDGLMITNPSEAAHYMVSSLFAPVSLPGATFYKKSEQTVQIEEAGRLFKEKPRTGQRPAEPQAKKRTAAKPLGEPIDGAQAAVRPKPLKKGPSVRTTALEEAGRLFKLGAYQQACETLEADAKSKDSPEECALLARIYANQGRLELAQIWCRRAISAERLNPAFQFLMATILMEQGLFKESVAALKKTLYLDPRFVLAYYMLAGISARLGDADGAARNKKNTMELLSEYDPEEPLPDSDGMTAGRLAQLAAAMHA